MKKLQTMTWMILCVACVFGASVDVDTARVAAENWMERSEVFQVEQVSKRSIASIQLMNDGRAYHVKIDPVGYIVVSAENRLRPVICFSTSSDLVLSDAPENALRAMLSHDLVQCYSVLEQIDREKSTLPDSVLASQKAWVDLLNSTQTKASSHTPTNILVDVMLDSTWSQWNHYNELCPSNPSAHASYDGKCAVGCVATAGGQLSYYHQWPPYGRDGHSYVDGDGSITGTHSAVFSDTFDWDDMLDDYDAYGSYPSEQSDAVSELLYELGVSVEMDYESNGSSSSTRDLGDAMAEWFFYTPSDYVERSDDPAAYDQRLRECMFDLNPTVITFPGHAFMADGLSSDAGTNFFHLNYGWGGQNDGWYQPTDLYNGSSLNYALFDSQPAFMPLFVSPLPAATNEVGSFTNHWAFPSRRQADVTRYRMKEGVYVPTNIVDDADDFDHWENSGGWYVAAEGYGGGNCFRKTGELGTYRLTTPEALQITSNSILSYREKTILVVDSFSVLLSTNAGSSWVTLTNVTGTGWNTTWYAHQYNLTAYEGSESLIRFEYEFGGGSYYGSNGAVWLDKIAISNVNGLSWTTLETNIATNVTSYAISGQSDGIYHYSVAAHDGTDWGDDSPFQSVTVLNDRDEDNLPGWWEAQYYGGATNAVATNICSNGINTVLEAYIAGLNPTNPVSIFELSNIWNTLQWDAVTGRIYRIYWTSNLLSGFQSLETNYTGSFTDTEHETDQKGFYKIEVELAP